MVKVVTAAARWPHNLAATFIIGFAFLAPLALSADGESRSSHLRVHSSCVMYHAA